MEIKLSYWQAWFLQLALESRSAVVPINPEQLNDATFTNDYGISQHDLNAELNNLQAILAVSGVQSTSTHAFKSKIIEPSDCAFTVDTVGGSVVVKIEDIHDPERGDTDYSISSHRFNEHLMRTDRPGDNMDIGHNEFKFKYPTTEEEVIKWLLKLGMKHKINL